MKEAWMLQNLEIFSSALSLCSTKLPKTCKIIMMYTVFSRKVVAKNVHATI